MKIGVIGCGVVGHATARTYVEDHEVRVYDKAPQRATHTFAEVLESDLIFVCLPTPQKAGSLECDTSVLDEFWTLLDCNGMLVHRRQSNFVLRSTVPIGYTRRTATEHKLPNLIHSPEFLTARCAVTDAQMPSRNIIGWPDYPNGFPEVDDLYQTRFPGIQTHYMTSDESEAVKLFTNGFFATKIAYFNEVRALSDKLGLGWDRVLAGMLSDGRISHNHTKVPGPDGNRGFGGECLPKDLVNLCRCFGENEVSNPVTYAAQFWAREKHD